MVPDQTKQSKTQSKTKQKQNKMMSIDSGDELSFKLSDLEGEVFSDHAIPVPHKEINLSLFLCVRYTM